MVTGRIGEVSTHRVRALGDWFDRHPLVGPGLAVIAWLLIVVFSSPWGRLWGTGQDAYCYWFPSLDDPYARSDWTDPIAYVYSPAFLQLLQPIRRLPWELYMAVWTLVLLGALVVLTGRRWLAVGLVLGAMELAGGNIHLLLAAAIVLLTKITPGIGLLWFAVRREWRALALAVGATAVIAGLSFVVLPDQWREWVDTVVRNVASGKSGTWASVPIPLWIRGPVAVAVVVWGARTDRPWTVPVASMLALPALWYGGLSMLLAVIALREDVAPVRPPGSRVRQATAEPVG